MKSSYFQLPLAALSLVFPNESMISMAGLILEYQMDGNLLTVTGRDGLLVNGFSVLSLPSSSSSQWQVDLAHNSVRVSSGEKNKDEEVVAKIHLRNKEKQSLKDGAGELLSIVQESASEGALCSFVDSMASTDDEVADTTMRNEASSDKLWSFDIDGGLGFLLEGNDNKITADCLLRDVKTSMEDKKMWIKVIQKMHIPGTIRLTEPIEDIVLAFNCSLLDLKIGSIVATLEEPPESQKPKSVDKNEKILSDASSTSIAAPSESSIKSSAAERSLSGSVVLPFGIKA